MTVSVITAMRASADGRAIRVERDGATWLRLPVHLVADLRLSTGQEMDAARVAEIEDAAALERLWEAVLRFTVARGRCRREVLGRLRDRRADEQQVARVMARLADAGLDDEEANADLRVERLAAKGWATRRIRSEMLGLGFPSETVRRAVADGLPAGHDQGLLERALERTGVPDSHADRTRMANRLMRQGIPPAAVREALRPDEGAHDARADAAPEAGEMVRQVRRRYPAQADDAGDRRRALGWLARRGVGADDARRILEAAAAPDD
jgi:SOS response regulatory protein OraA/RecX